MLDSIEDARFSAALIPWPLAPHISSFLARGDELLMAVNRSGCLSLAPWTGNASAPNNAGVALRHFSGGDFWQQYTVGAFVLINEKPAALLYRDDRFLDSGFPLPSPRTWTIAPGGLEPLVIPALEHFPAEEGWDADTLRLGPDGGWYFRVTKKGLPQPEIRMLRTADPDQAGEAVSLGGFQNSALPEPLSAAPPLLRDLLGAAFGSGGIGGGAAAVTSPEFQQTRYFGKDGGDAPLLVGYCHSGPDGSVALTILPDGRGLYTEQTGGGEETESAFKSFALPPLPEHFVYTGIAFAGDTLVAAWEEQEDYNIGAAGFMAILPAW